MDQLPADSGDPWSTPRPPWEAPPPGASPPPRQPGDPLFLAFVVIAGAAIALILVYFGIRALQLQAQLQQAPPTAPATIIPTPTEVVVDAPLTRTVPLASPTVVPLPTGGSTEDVVQRTMQSVVRVEAGDAEGTAFMVRQQGSDALFVTNAHVVEGTSTVTLVTRDGLSHPGVVLARDPRVDLAILDVRKLTG